MKTDEYFMGEALKEARHALGMGILPVGVVISLGNEIIARGFKNGISPRFGHAELVSMARAESVGHKWGHEMTIYTTLETCFMCFAMALNYQMSKIVYAMEDPFAGISSDSLAQELLPAMYRHRLPIITSGPLREESRLLLRKFFATTDQQYWFKTPNPLVQACFL